MRSTAAAGRYNARWSIVLKSIHTDASVCQRLLGNRFEPLTKNDDELELAFNPLCEFECSRAVAAEP